MNSEIEKIASSLSSAGKLIVFEPNSVLNYVETFNSKDTLNTVTNQIVNKINNELILIKNKLLPFMNEIAKLCSDKIEKMEDTTVISKYLIKTIDVPELIKEMKSIGILDDKTEPVKLGVNSISIAVPDLEEIRNYFVSKDTKISHYIDTILATKKDEELTVLWEKYLSNVSDSNLNFEALYRNPIMQIEDIILLYSLVQNIRDEKPKGCSVRDDIYLTVMQVYSKEIKNLMAIAYENFTNDRKIGRLVLTLQDEFTTIVDKELYDRFLDEGGTPETILGFCLDGKFDLNSCFYETIKSKQEEYVTKWNNKVKLEGFNSITASVNRYKALYNIVLKIVYDAYIPKDLNEDLTCDYYTANSYLNKILPTLSNDELLDHNYVSRVIVGDIMFSNTNFTKFATTMLSYMDINKTFTQQDAATFASFDIIVDYLISQIGLDGLQQENVTKREYLYTWPL